MITNERWHQSTEDFAQKSTVVWLRLNCHWCLRLSKRTSRRACHHHAEVSRQSARWSCASFHPQRRLLRLCRRQSNQSRGSAFYWQQAAFVHSQKTSHP